MKKTNLFQIPVKLGKAENKEYWLIEGLASCEDEDLQGEIINQNGFDLGELNKRKLIFNDNHSKSTEDIIGIVDDAKINKDGLYVKGKLFKNNPKAKTYRNLLKHNGFVGFSVEGFVKKRDSFNKNVVKEAKVTAVALTRHPVNEKTYAKLLKSLYVTSPHESVQSDSTPIESEGYASLPSDNINDQNDNNKDVTKALTPGGPQYTGTPDSITGGSVFMTESKEDKERKKKIKKKTKQTLKAYKKLYKNLSNKEVIKRTLNYFSSPQQRKYISEEFFKSIKTSAKPPKGWWNKMVSEIKQSNPGYSDKQIRETVGDIWYNKMGRKQRSQKRKVEGKKLKKILTREERKELLKSIIAKIKQQYPDISYENMIRLGFEVYNKKIKNIL